MAKFVATVSTLAAAMLMGAAVQASVIVTSGDFTGSRATTGTSGSGGGLLWNPAAGQWSNGDFSIGWGIVQNGSNYTYTYTINTANNDTTGSAKLSHWILELSPVDENGNSLEAYWESVFVGLTQGNFTDTGIGSISAGEVGPTTAASGNPGMPAAGIWGVRFTRDSFLNTTIVTFTTPQVPVWGDFYARDGGGTGPGAIWAYNVGFGTDPTGIDFTNWIARPDGTGGGGPPGGIPEPASLLLVSIALLGAAAVRRRKIS